MKRSFASDHPVRVLNRKILRGVALAHPSLCLQNGQSGDKWPIRRDGRTKRNAFLAKNCACGVPPHRDRRHRAVTGVQAIG